MHNIYCSSGLCESLLDEDSLLIKIANLCGDLVVDLEDTDLLKLIEINPIAKQLMKRDTGSLYNDKEAFEKIDNCDYSSFLSDILILDKNKDVKKIRQKYGVLALHIKDDFLKEQNYYFGYSLNGEKQSRFKKWEDIFSVKLIEPLNSAILVDNFLWDDLEKFNTDNDENIFPILERLVPSTLEVPFRLTIVVENGNGRFNPVNMAEKIKKIERKFKKRTGISAEVDIITHSTKKVFHERVLVTNFHYIYSDKGFTVFRDRRYKNKTKGDRNWIFMHIENYEGEIRKHHHQDVIRSVKEALIKSKRLNTSAIFYSGTNNNPLLN